MYSIMLTRRAGAALHDAWGPHRWTPTKTNKYVIIYIYIYIHTYTYVYTYIHIYTHNNCKLDVLNATTCTQLSLVTAIQIC